MSAVADLFGADLSVVNVGLEMFADDIAAQGAGVTHLEWAPPGGGKPEVLRALEVLERPEIAARIEAANREALERITSSQPMLVGFGQAIDVVPGMTRTTILHAGPPIAFENMSGPMRGAVAGALVFEGLATDIEDAYVVAASGDITFAPCHEHGCVGSMAGVTSASMYMHVVENATYGNRSYTNLSEQLAKVLRMGANDQTVMDRLAWMRDVLGPILEEAMQIGGPIDLRLMLAQALHMGDECHNRNVAGTTLLIQALAPRILQTHFTEAQKVEVFDFVASSDYFSGPTWMAMAKAALDAAHGIEYSTVLTTMARNGVEHGLRVSGIEGDTWFTGPAQPVIGPMFAGYKPEDSGLDIGDSAITETYGIGGFAMSAAPAIVALVGGTVDEAVDVTRQMREITTGENPNVTIPLLGFMGVPTGIDVRKVELSGILPTINTAIAHREAGIGMIGAGITHPPMEAFDQAIVALAERLESLAAADHS
ncbi:oxamate carbamoyltransferase subunit AllG family protein [Monashia sp. NPDC004114]